MADAHEDIEEVSVAIADGLREGKSPIQSAREFRDMSRSELAGKVGLEPSEAPLLDEGLNPGRMLLKNLVLALDVPGDVLVDDRASKPSAESKDDRERRHGREDPTMAGDAGRAARSG